MTLIHLGVCCDQLGSRARAPGDYELGALAKHPAFGRLNPIQERLYLLQIERFEFLVIAAGRKRPWDAGPILSVWPA
jgi:hypothetical protein